MSQTDSTKSQITSLRYGLSVLITIISVCVGLLVNDFRSDKIDIITFASLIFAVVALLASFFTQRSINEKSKELKEM